MRSTAPVHLPATTERHPAPRRLDPQTQRGAGRLPGRDRHVRALLLKADFHRETVKFLGSRLGVSKRQTWNIIYEMERRGLVNVIWDPHHKQRRLVELRQMMGTSYDI